jgi:hypothetical protein
MGDQNLLSRAPPCFGRHVKPLVLAEFAVVCTHCSFKEVRQAAGRKNNCRIFITTWRKHVVPTPLSGIRIGRRREHCTARISRELALISSWKCIAWGSVGCTQNSRIKNITKFTLLQFLWRDYKIIHTYIPLTLYARRGSRGISDIPPRHPRFTKIS